ncbi:MAG: 4-hydroxythreonine-4-phosphate dehydrogenase PdxA [Alphaproteobacteria bacterium]|nr:4-hydroxythreonine-4-phosphate dehydrogenase PdxA [Alphaproteobacteria bacterium]MDX5368404.1 4-hydroxythreonine-4-phosphate dehydrogenase PdxA [Alphaproteobacteria bacterium]MDX5463199.1 4-hydroxythreonine-4-phosphate dehydrogenase PdxA [Alphaproteobacteria bacterium]
MGDPAGVAPELTLKAWAAVRGTLAHPLVADADADMLASTARRLSLDVPIHRIGASDLAGGLPDTDEGALVVRHRPLPGPTTPGAPDPSHAAMVIESLETAAADALAGRAAGIVTNPVAKHTLHTAGFAYPGQTEFFEDRAGVRGLMMLVSPKLRVVPLTIHIPLREVPGAVTRDAILAALRIMDRVLKQDFGIPRPRIAVSGLNPHAGESGDIGTEEIETIAPAIATAQAEGIAVRGPLPADTLFHDAARTGYDAALCMYHDQALVASKALDFDNGVNATVGLPIIRTSPDHGTAFDIAGKGVARPDSLIAAILLADLLAARREETR